MAKKATTRQFYDPIESVSRDELSALQLKRLKRALSYTYDRVEHYRKKCVEADAHPGDLKTLADLAKFPFTTKQDLRDTYPYGMFATPLADVVRIHASSGTTGRPTVVGYTRNDIDMWSDIMARSIHAAGGRSTDIMQNAYGYGLFTGGLGFHYGGERLGAAVIPMSGGQSEKQVQFIMEFKPTIICATPSYMLALAEEFHRQGVDPGKSSLRLGLFGAEPWSNEMRREIEALFRIDAIDFFGLSEVVGPGVAVECIEAKDGPHIWEDHFYPEIIDPATGDLLPDGEFGELVFTSLTKEALPVMRYRTRDLTRLLPGTARSMRRMDKIAGRSDDMLIIRGVNVFPSQIEERILRNKELAPHYVLEISRDKRLDKLAILVEMKAGLGECDEARQTRVALELEHHVKSYIGISTQVRVVPTGTLERSVGKAKRVIDLRPK